MFPGGAMMAPGWRMLAGFVMTTVVMQGTLASAPTFSMGESGGNMWAHCIYPPAAPPATNVQIKFQFSNTKLGVYADLWASSTAAVSTSYNLPTSNKVTGYYRCSVTINGGSSADSDSVMQTFVVKPTKPLLTSSPADVSDMDAGSSVTWTCTASEGAANSPITSYKLYRDGNLEMTSTNKDMTMAKITPGDEGPYSCNAFSGAVPSDASDSVDMGVRACDEANGWDGPDNGNCYKIFVDKVTYSMAVMKCYMEGGQLAVPTSSATNTYMKDLRDTYASGSTLHLPFRRLNGDNTQWKHESSVIPLNAGDFTFWKSNDPVSDATHNCAVMEAGSDKWINVKCGEWEHVYMCSKPEIDSDGRPKPTSKLEELLETEVEQLQTDLQTAKEELTQVQETMKGDIETNEDDIEAIEGAVEKLKHVETKTLDCMRLGNGQPRTWHNDNVYTWTDIAVTFDKSYTKVPHVITGGMTSYDVIGKTYGWNPYSYSVYYTVSVLPGTLTTSGFQVRCQTYLRWMQGYTTKSMKFDWLSMAKF